MKPIEHLTITFYELMRIGAAQPTIGRFYSNSLSLAFAMLVVESLDTKSKNKAKVNEFIDKLTNIEKYTHPELNLPLAVAEAIIDSHPKEKWGGEYTGYDANDEKILIGERGRPAKYIDIYRLIKESYTSIVKIVAEISQPYSIEFKSMPESSGIWGAITTENKSG